MQATASAQPASQDVAPEQLAEELLVLITHIFRSSGAGFYRLVSELDFNFTHVKTLHILDAAGELPVKRLGELTGLSFPAASRTVEGLLQRGYLERREDPADRRSKLIRLTPEGATLVSRLDRERAAGLAAFASTLTARERTRLSKAVASLIERDDIAHCRDRIAGRAPSND